MTEKTPVRQGNYVVDLDQDAPQDPSQAAAYWCEMDLFLAHTATGDWPPCNCPKGRGHDDAALYPEGQ